MAKIINKVGMPLFVKVRFALFALILAILCFLLISHEKEPMTRVVQLEDGIVTKVVYKEEYPTITFMDYTGAVMPNVQYQDGHWQVEIQGKVNGENDTFTLDLKSKKPITKVGDKVIKTDLGYTFESTKAHLEEQGKVAK